MANHYLPTLTSSYTEFLSNFKDRIDDACKLFDPATTTPTNLPIDSIRWNSTSKKHEKFDGTTWSDLSTLYNITVLASNNLTGGNNTTQKGSIPYQSDTNITSLLAPNASMTRKFLRQSGNGTNGDAPVWDTLIANDIPTLNQNTTGSAAKLTTPRSITLTGDVGGTVNFDGSINVSIETTVADDSHTHDGRYYTEAEIGILLAGKLGVNDTAANASKLNGQNWYWSGQGGQPSWLWGGNDGSNMYVWNPSNFTVWRVNDLANHQWDSKGQNGYIRLSTGLILQWGLTGGIGANSTAIINFPTAFPNGCLILEVTKDTSDYSTADYAVNAWRINTSQFGIANGANGTFAVYWFAIGY